jgi:hypothetical protein
MLISDINEAKKSIAWYRSLVLNMANEKRIKESGFGEVTKSLTIGGLYFYRYDPKLKDILPIYDKFPLVIPIEPYPDSFLGLNLHYLPTDYRQVMFKKLSSVTTRDKIAVTYGMLKGVSRLKPFQVCIKKYLYSHIESRFIEIDPLFWNMAIKLPVAQFVEK